MFKPASLFCHSNDDTKKFYRIGFTDELTTFVQVCHDSESSGQNYNLLKLVIYGQSQKADYSEIGLALSLKTDWFLALEL